MKQECNIIRDLLPLYVEGMVSEETASFVKSHMEQCSNCQAEYIAMCCPMIPEVKSDNEAPALHAVKKRLRRRMGIAIAITSAVVILGVALLSVFPIYRLPKMNGMAFPDNCTAAEIASLMTVGSPVDRAAAQAILRQADEAFRDCSHTSEENLQKYGKLARYATPLERGATYTEYTLELWSAHLDQDSGYIWVYYSHDAFDANGERVRGSSRIPSLWLVEKTKNGQWAVVDIKEHP